MTRPRQKCAAVVLLLPLVALFGAVRAWEVFHPLSSLAETAAHDHLDRDESSLCSLVPSGSHNCIHTSTIFNFSGASTHLPVSDAEGDIGRTTCRGSLVGIRFLSTRDPPSFG